MTAGSDYEEVDCPLCLEELDLTDRAIQYCACGYRMCLWCYHHILEEAGKASLPAKCPNCRSEYDQDKITMQHIDAEKLEEEKRKNKEKDKKPGAAEAAPKSRASLTNVRVVQPNLVYAVGLPLEICNEDLLREQEYFGQFGKVFKISVNRSNQFASALAKHGPTGSAYVTFRRPEDALRCIKLLDGSCWKGKPIKACFGTTKYCNAFLKGVVCNNPDCLYLHDLADEADCLTKEEVAAGLLPARFMAMGASNTFKPRLTINPIQNATTAAAQAAAAAAVAAGQPMSAVQAAAAAAGGVNRLPCAGAPAQPRTAAVQIAPRIVLNDGGGSSSGMWGSPCMASLGSAGTSAPKSGATWAAISAGGAGAAAPAAGPPPPPPTDDQEWPELGGPATNAAGGGGGGSQPSGAASPEREEISEGLSRGGSLAMPGSQNGATMAEQLARAHSNPPDKGGAGYGGAGAAAKPAKKLLPLSSPAKLKPLSKQPPTQQLQRGGTAAADSSSVSAAPAGECRKELKRVGSPPSSPSGAPAAPSQSAAQPEQQATPVAATMAAEAAPPSANGSVVGQQPAGEQGLGAPAGSISDSENLAAQHAAGAEPPAVQPAVEPVASKPRLVPPPGFAAPAAGAGGGPAPNGTTQPRPKKITPPPGFGGPPAPISNGVTPSASAHTSIDSLSQLGDASSARGGMPAAATPAAVQQEAYSAFSAFSTAASSGSLFSSSNSLVERLPSVGELQVAAVSSEVLPPVAPLAPTAAIPISTGRSKSRFKFAQTEGAGQGAGAAGGHSAQAAAPVQPAPAAATAPVALPHQQPASSASSAFNPLSTLQQPQLHQPAQASPSAQDAGAFFKSLFPGVNINVSSTAAAPRQPPPGFGPPASALGGYGSTDGGSGLLGGPNSTSPAPYLGTSPAAAMYNPLAGMFASPQQPPQFQQHHLMHHHQQQQHAQQLQQQQQGLGGGVGLSPGLALLRQLQGAGAGQHHQQQQAQQAQQYHQQQQQQAAQAQYAQSQYGQLQLGGGFMDPAIMAARPAAPPGFGGNLGMSSGLLGYDRPRPSMPPPGFGLQF